MTIQTDNDLSDERKARRDRALRRQIERLGQRIDAIQRQERRLTLWRLLSFVGTLLVSGVAYFSAGAAFFGPLFAAGMTLFFVLVALHRRLSNELTRHERWRRIKQVHLARMRHEWAELPPEPWPAGDRRTAREGDLDIVGPASLHRLCDVSTSYDGSVRLREWLNNDPLPPDLHRQRQTIVAELINKPLWRDRLQLNASLAQEGDFPWSARGLLVWLESHAPDLGLRRWLQILAVLAVVNVTLLLLDLLAGWPAYWQASTAIYALIYILQTRRLEPMFKEAALLQDGIKRLLEVFKHFERERYHRAPALRALCEPFLNPASRPSTFLRRVARVVNATGLRGNPAVWLLLNAPFPWDFYFGYRLSQFKVEMAGRLPVWLDVWFELEALSGLATLGYLNPSYVMPEVRPAGSEPLLSAKNLGHPLIPDAARVCNDYVLERSGRVDILTGSNMSGKSSFLRTAGLNTVLAYAGGPVAADRFTVAPLRLFTAIKVTDSVADGISYFYAEVKRLRALLEALDQPALPPLFFLIDEIFRGTNNRERLIGSRAYIAALVNHHGAGIISTHDLELVNLADEIDGIENYHFRESVADGRMVFDYKLRSGPSPTTNALQIMRLEGLPVPENGQATFQPDAKRR